MLSPFKFEFSVEEFVTFIHSMEDKKLIFQYYKANTSILNYVQLPPEVSKSFSMLERNLHDEGYLKLYLKKFCNVLVNAALADNYTSSTPIETKQAKLLLVFLLHIDATILVANERIKFEEMVNNTNLFNLTCNPKAWINAYDPNLLRVFENLWQHFVTMQTIERSNKAKKEQLEIEYQEKMHGAQLDALAKYFNDRATYTFEFDSLNLENLSYAIEGYIAQDKIRLFSNKAALFRPELSQKTSALLNTFNFIAQYKGKAIVTQDEIFEALLQVLSSLIHYSTHQNPHQLASLNLIGFMLYHNFEIEHLEHKCKISQLFSQWDFEIHFSQEWFAEQAYPNKQELENLVCLVQNQKKSFLNSFNQYNENTMDEDNKSLLMEIEETPRFNSLFKC